MRKFIRENPDRRSLLKKLYDDHGILPWDERVMHATAPDLELFALVLNDGATVESAPDIPTDPMLAAYELPTKIPGFEKQEEKLRALIENGQLRRQRAPIPNEPITFDPARGLGLPNFVPRGGAHG